MSAVPLPNGKMQFVDINGAPLVGGTVEHYEPGTLTPKDTWGDPEQTVLNNNPVVLDGRGQAPIFGIGEYRQIVKDSAGNQIWDVNTVAYVSQTAYLNLAFSYAGSSPPVSDAFLGGFAIPLAATFPVNFSSPTSQFHADATPNATYVISVLKNGSSVGSLSIATSGVCTFTTSGFSVVPGDRITLIGQFTPDSTLNNFFGTLVGTFS